MILTLTLNLMSLAHSIQIKVHIYQEIAFRGGQRQWDNLAEFVVLMNEIEMRSNGAYKKMLDLINNPDKEPSQILRRLVQEFEDSWVHIHTPQI